jgi:hypothetical protein
VEEQWLVGREPELTALAELVEDAAAGRGRVALIAGEAAGFSAMPQLLVAFRTGAGVPYASYGTEAVEAQAALNRPAFVNQLVADWIPQIPDVAHLGERGRATRVADVGCGLG